MTTEETKTVQILASQKAGASSGEDSDREWQQSKTDIVQGTFDVAEGHHHYRPIDSYEGLHRWDPNFQWTELEEKRLVRKVC